MPSASASDRSPCPDRAAEAGRAEPASADRADETAVLIGPPGLLDRLERQLDLLPCRPVSLGWVVTADAALPPDANVLGTVDDLEAIVARRRPNVALLTLPGVMHDLIAGLRTRLRRLGVPDRFMPTLEDQVAGVGPRSHIDIDPGALLDRPPRRIDSTRAAGLIAGRRVLITGAGGSIGSEIARIAARYEPAQLQLMDRAENALFEIDRQIARTAPDLERYAVLHDVVDPDGTLEHCRRFEPQLIFHAAAHKHVPMMEHHPGAAIDNNLFGTKSIVDAADAVGTDRFVMISTDKAVNPSSIMGATKRLAELYVQHVNQRSATACSIVRFGNVLGSAGSVLDTWSHQIADGGPLTVTDPKMTRYFMTIPEAAALVIESAALVDPEAPLGEVFLLDMGEPVRVLDMARRFIRLHGLEPNGGGAGGMPIVFTGARPGEKLHEELAFDAESMRPTGHADVNVWLLPPPTEGLIKEVLCVLDPDYRDPEPGSVAEAVRRLVPEMVPACTGS